MTAKKAKRGKKIVLVLVPFPMSGEHLDMRIAQSKQLDFGRGIEFYYKPVKWAGTNFVGPYDYVLGDFSVLEAGLSAQQDGYDAMCIDTMSNSGIAANLPVPVISPGPLSYGVAQMLLTQKLAHSRKADPSPVGRSDVYLHAMLDAAMAAAHKGPEVAGIEGGKKNSGGA